MFELNEKTATIRASGSIGFKDTDGFTPGSFKQALDLLDGRDVEIRLNSPGGDIADGINVFGQLERYSGRVTVVVDAEASSIANVMMQAADEVLALPESKFTVHNPWTIAMGDATAFRNTAAILDSLGDDIADVYAEHTDRPQRYWLEEMENTRVFSAPEALEVGLIDGIIEGAVKPQNRANAYPPRLGYLRATQVRLAAERKQVGL